MAEKPQMAMEIPLVTKTMAFAMECVARARSDGHQLAYQQALIILADEVERLRADHEQYAAWASPQLERLGREMAENERLRAALGPISRMVTFPDAAMNMVTLSAAKDIARKALEGSAHEPFGKREP